VAVKELEARSREMMLEKEEKQRLEEKIKALNSQLLVGGKKIEDTPQFKSALEERQRIIR
jgi:kinesin family protein 3/17